MTWQCPYDYDERNDLGLGYDLPAALSNNDVSLGLEVHRREALVASRRLEGRR